MCGINGVDSREVAREMLKAHLKKVRGMTVQDKEMAKTRHAAKKKLKSDGILRAVMGNASSGDWEADLVARNSKPKKPKARKAWSSAEESSDEELIKPRKKKVKQEKEPKGVKRLAQIRCVPGKPLYGLNGYVPLVRAGARGMSQKLSETAPTDFSGSCNFCGTQGHTSLDCDRRSEVDGETVHPLAYLFKKGLVNEWGLITEKGKKKKGLRGQGSSSQSNLGRA